MHIKTKFFSLLAITLSTISVANAVATGWFVGGQTGLTNTHNQTQTVYTGSGTPPTLTAKPSNSGVGARIFTGYNFNQNAAFEMGFTHYAASSYSVPESAGLSNDPAIRESGLDIVGKGILPVFTSGLSVFGKAGFSIMSVSKSGSLVAPTTTSSSKNSSSSTSVRPLIGFGASYDLSQNWVTDLSFTHVLGGGTVKSADFMAIGMSYHWVDKYCGQFLC